MPDNLLSLLNLCLLALLYLFFVRVLWAVWAEVRGSKVAPAAPVAAGSSGRSSGRRSRREVRPASRLVVCDPPERAGLAFDLSSELLIGRAPECRLAMPDDTYMSQRHARVVMHDGDAYVEDLASTNGTYVNGARVTSPSPLRRGDRLQVGTTVLEAS